MPMTWFGHVDPEMERLRKSLMKLQVRASERALEREEEEALDVRGVGGVTDTLAEDIARAQLALQERQQVAMERQVSLAERKQDWAEEQATWPTYATVEGVLLATYPTGEVVEAWQAPPPEPKPIVLKQTEMLLSPEGVPMVVPGIEIAGALVDPITGEPKYAPPVLTATDTELIITERLSGDVMNKIPINQLPPEAQFFADKYGNVVALDKQTGSTIMEYTNPAGEEMMRREAVENEQDYQLKVRTEDRLWETMYVDEELGKQANLTPIQVAGINADVRREGFQVDYTGFAVTERIADKNNLSLDQRAALNAGFTKRGQDLEYKLGMSRIDMEDMLGKGKLKISAQLVRVAERRVGVEEEALAIRRQAEERAWEAMYIDEELRKRANLTPIQVAEINADIRREGFQVTREGYMISERIADKHDLAAGQRAALNAGLTERGQDIERELGMTRIEMEETLGKGKLAISEQLARIAERRVVTEEDVRDIQELAEKRAWEKMYIDKDLSEATGLREEQRMGLNKYIADKGFEVTREGYAIRGEIADKLNLTTANVAALNATISMRGQDFMQEYNMDKLALDEVLGMGELAVKERAEKRGWEQMYVSKELAESMGMREDRRIEINAILTREGYDVQRDRTAITWRIAQMDNLTTREKMLISTSLKAEDQRIESMKVRAEIEAGKFMKVGDVIIQRKDDDSIEVAFKYPAAFYPPTPIKIGDSKTGYKVGLINPRDGTLDWLSTTPGGAAGDEEADRRLELLKQAVRTIDPQGIFMASFDQAIRAQGRREIFALYGDLLQTEMGYSPEEAARFSTPLGLWKAYSDTTLSFAGERPEITPALHEKFIRSVPYSKAVPFEPPSLEPPSLEPPPGKKRAYDSTYWLDTFKFFMDKDTKYHLSIQAAQQEMKDRGVWDGPVDGIMTKEFERAFKLAYRRGKIKMTPRGQ